MRIAEKKRKEETSQVKWPKKTVFFKFHFFKLQKSRFLRVIGHENEFWKLIRVYIWTLQYEFVWAFSTFAISLETWKKRFWHKKDTLGFDWNEHNLKAKINCNGLYELLGTYEGSLGICVHNFEAVLQVVLLSPKNRKKSENNWIDAPDIVSKRLASNNLLKILYKDCLESVLQKRWKLCKCAPSEEVRVILFFIIFSLETMLNVSLEILWLTLSLLPGS